MSGARFVLLSGVLCALLVPTLASAQPPQVRISQIWGYGAVNATAPNAPYIELYNAGSSNVNLTDWSVQLSQNGLTTGWSVVPLSGTIQAHHYFLIKLGASGTTGVELSVPDATTPPGFTNAIGRQGKVALLSKVTPLIGRPECPMPESVVDFVGYGPDSPGQDQRLPCTPASATNHNAPICQNLPILLAIHRGCGGQKYTGDNVADFVALPPLPRNSSVIPQSTFPPALALSPSTLKPLAGTSFTITAYATACSSPVASITADLSSLGGPSSIPMTPQGNDVFTTSLSLASSLSPGSHTISVTITDANGSAFTAAQTVQVLAAVPGNDSCLSASLPACRLTAGVPVTGNGQSADAELFAVCPSAVGHTVWYTFTPAQSRTYRITTCGSPSSADTALGLFTTQDCQTFSILGCNDDSSACLPLTSFRHLSAITFPLVAGSTYYIRVGCNGPFQLQAEIVPLAGESCDQATSLQTFSGGVTTFTGSNEFAQTPLDGAPFGCAAGAVKDVWIRFLCPYGVLDTWQIDTCGSSFDTVMEVYQSSGGCPTNQLLGCNDDAQIGDCVGSSQSALALPLRASTFYIVRVAAKTGSAGGTIRLNIRNLNPPFNGTCASANGFSSSIDNRSANNSFDNPALDPNAPPITCGPASKDVFWVFNPQASGSYDIFTCPGTAQDTILQVIDGCGPAASVLACNDDTTTCGDGTQSKVTVQLSAGHDYYLRVASKGANAAGGPVYLDMVRTPPANDACEAAIAISENVEISGATYGADVTTPLPSSLCGPSSDPNPAPFPDVFYSFIPQSTGLYSIDTCGSPTYSSLSVHPGCPATALNTIACKQQSGSAICPNTAERIDNLQLIAGQPYIIRVASQGFPGPFLLHLNRIAVAGACCRGAICSLSQPQNCSTPGVFYSGDGSVCNAPGNPTTPCCLADFDHAGGLSVQDIFAFLNFWFAGDPRANISGGPLDLQDVFQFLNLWFAGC